MNKTVLHIFAQMTLQELQKPALQLSTGDRPQLVEVLLESLKTKLREEFLCKPIKAICEAAPLASEVLHSAIS